ncbi:HEAT repeat domain-containing protein [Candidatus Entotheonella palauensis]|uniref:HEAT repeat domain-containing protein n=1 Tax=Candidatus Entotheonella palauensis TaxID=93172 RepID=UPI0015C4D464|nr:HEAT repeat domain-containing protein [Candidatus Entotheonella palauensis]
MRFPWSSESRRARRARHKKSLVQLPFLGREGLLESLDAHLQAAQEGTPQYVLLEGAAGSGKSSLLTEFTLLRCRSAKLFVSRVNVDGCISEWACVSQLFDELRVRSEAVLKRLYDDSKRIRKALSTDWDEEAFRGFLMSADWAKLQETAEAETRESRERADVLTQLLLLAREHPWGVGAATMLDVLMRPQPDPSMWQQHWMAILEALKAKGLPSGAALVLVFDQLDSDFQIGQDSASLWASFWQSFIETIAAAQIPVLVMWAGSARSTVSVRQALNSCSTAAIYPLEALANEDEEQFLRRLQRALPRDAQSAWQPSLSTMDDTLRHVPGHVLLAATSVAAQVDMQKKSSSSFSGDPSNSVLSGVDQSLEVLVQASRARDMSDEAVFDHCLEVLAFLPPETSWTVDDLMQLCHLETLGLEPADGRDALEALLGVWVRYGLLQYDGYAESYMMGQSLIQDGLRRRLYPNEAARLEVISRRYMAASLLAMIQKGDGAALSALCASFQGRPQADDLSGSASVILPAFRNMMRTMTKRERLQVAAVLGVLPAPFVVDMLQGLMQDEEDQVRSRAVQSLTELEGVDTFPLLLEALDDANSDVRWIATRALIDVDAAATVDTLIRLLTDEDKEVGRVAAEGLGRRGDQRAVPHLIEAIQDSYPLLRESAAVALGLLADQRAVPALQECLADDSQKVRRSAEAALARFPT